MRRIFNWIKKAVTFDSDVTVSGNLKGEASAEIDLNFVVNGDSTFNGAAGFEDSIAIGGEATFGDNSTFEGNVSIDGNIIPSGHILPSDSCDIIPNGNLRLGDPDADNYEAFVSINNAATGAIVISAPEASLTLIANSLLFSHGIPTSDPVNAGQIWNDSGTLKISAGT